MFRSPHRNHPRLSWPAVALGLCAAGIVPAALAVGTFSMDGHVISNAFSQHNSSVCFELAASAGQPVIGGPFSSANYIGYSGFWQAYPPDQDTVFSGRFESCGP